MGINYYVNRNACPTCHRSEDGDRMHIGKSSAGWCFSLHVDPGGPDGGIRDIDDWERIWSEPESAIVNEYGDTVTVEDMRAIIMARAGKPFEEKDWSGYHNEAAFHRQNRSERGPNGMLRHRLTGDHCIGHGSGTWDLIVGEFS